MTCPICSWSPNIPDYPLIYETAFWLVVLAPNQSLLGRCIVHLKRHCGDGAETTREEHLDWLDTITVIETVLHSAFSATMFNPSCYMNLAFKERSPDPHIHSWIVPRYDHTVKVAGIPSKALVLATHMITRCGLICPKESVK